MVYLKGTSICADDGVEIFKVDKSKSLKENQDRLLDMIIDPPVRLKGK